MTDPDTKQVALAILDDVEDRLVAANATDDETVERRLINQSTVLIEGVSVLVDEDGEFTDDLSDFYGWAEENGVEVHG